MTTTSVRSRGRVLRFLGTVAAGLCVASLSPPALASQGAPLSAGGARAFLRIELPKRAAYVGESLPATVRAYFRGDTAVEVTGAPALANTDFTLTESDPAQGHADIGGATYLVVTWKGRLSPVKAGRYALSMSLPSTLKWQNVIERPREDSSLSSGGAFRDPFGDFFDDPSMGQDIFRQMQRRMQQMMSEAESNFDVGAVQQKDVVLHSPDAVLEVLPLPAQGRPAGFSGAVGRFDVSGSAHPTDLRAGEPTTVELRVSGQGGFDRVDLPGVADSSDWKAYPTSAKQVDDKTKLFTQAVVARHAGILALPPVALSYFDPEAAHYVTVETKPIALNVSAGVSIAATSNGTIPTALSGPTLAPDADATGQPVRSLAPVFERRGFWMAQAVPFLGLGAVLTGVIFRRRVAADLDRPLRRRADRALEGYRTEMDRAVAQSDAVAFFAAARGAFQQRLGARWRVNPDAITLSEIEGRLPTGDAQAIRQVFDSDAARFSGLKLERADLAQWRQVVSEQLRHLEDQ